MKLGFYSRLAVNGMKKNGKLYLPFLMTSVLMVVVIYIMGYLSSSDLVESMGGGSSTVQILKLGLWVMDVFSIIFLFYTNSFLIKRRRKEFGLFNVLGMNKKNISRVLFFEVLFSYIVSIVFGLIFGIALSKLAELALVRLVHADINYRFMVPGKVIVYVLVLFIIIFTLIYLNSLRTIKKASAIDLVKSDNYGEKPPKANWVIAILGVVILAAAYFLALKIKQPLEALIFFMIAVIMVIIATYMLFIAGSVTVCKLLKKNTNYYYKKKNFVSVSSMTYRMKRNGAGLASICILLTMVIVMISSSSCLFFGKDVAIKAQYPRDINVFASHYGYSKGDSALSKNLLNYANSVVGDDEIVKASVKEYYEYSIMGYIEDSNVEISLNSSSNLSFLDYSDICEVHFIRLEDYNRNSGKNETLEDGEALVCAVKTDQVGDVFKVADKSFNVVKRLDGEALDFDGKAYTSVTSNVFVVVKDIDSIASSLNQFEDVDGTKMVVYRWYYQFDSETEPSRQVEICNDIDDSIGRKLTYDKFYEGANGNYFTFYSRSENGAHSDFYGTFGGLFFIGLLLSIVFLIACALIMYYKQLSEGFEDQARFEIMQNVGMTKEDIRKSINSQMLTVFFAPLIAAVIHTAFAFPMINKMLMIFGVVYTSYLLKTALIAALVSALFYVVFYRVTSNTYYKIVSGR